MIMIIVSQTFLTELRYGSERVTRGDAADYIERLQAENAELREEVAHHKDELNRLGGCIHYQMDEETDIAFIKRIDACDRCGTKVKVISKG